VRVDLNQPIAVGHLDPKAEAAEVAHRRHLSARSRVDRSAVRPDDVDALVEVKVAAVGRVEPERRRPESLDDR